ncbi:hypothetical protein SAMN05192549_10984 [Duganella sacchari]|uniref:MatE family transporter n=1 Tax=Duganella sacchari TaxID=551987 RepID=A0A1M7R0W0_9BURK|nr:MULTISPECIES: hypothetical protein [Duganella]SHN38250.1 hypothetical protein SAMN05192549_10984 [Duganella sacchari]
MADSTLDPDNIPAGTDRILGKGHGTRALGPSDNSDSGSDVTGEPDSELDSDTDAQGTGERASVGMENIESDIGFDHVETIPVVDGEFREQVPADDETAEHDVPPQLRSQERRDWSRTS